MSHDNFRFWFPHGSESKIKAIEFEMNDKRYWLVDNIESGFEPVEPVVEIGRVRDFSENDFADVVDYWWVDGLGYKYKDYSTGGYIWKAKKSFYSKMTRLGVSLFKNPRQLEWDEVCTWGYGSDMTMADYEDAEIMTFRNPYLYEVKEDEESDDDFDNDEILGYQCSGCGNIQSKSTGFGCDTCSGRCLEPWFG